MIRGRGWAGLVLVVAGAVVLGVVEPAVAASASKPHLARIEPGSAAATANVFGLSPAVSGLSLTTTIGESSAAYQHSETQAKSGIFDMGSLGLVLATSTFCGQSLLPSSSQPQPIKANSETGPRHITMGSAGLGTEEVSVVRDPQSASATTTTINQNLPGLLSVQGYSHAVVRYIDGREQVATSDVVETVSLLGGQVRLEGMRWSAERRTGVTSSHTTHFSLGRVTIAGVPVSAPDSATGIDRLNTMLATTGLSIRQPARTTNPRTGSVSLGPLMLRFSGSTVERQLIAPAAKVVVAIEDAMHAAGSPGDNCAHIRELIQNLGNNDSTLLNVAIGISQGAGALDVQLGGVAAATLNQTAFDDPFGGGEPPTVPAVGPNDAAPATHPAGVVPSSRGVTGVGPATTSPQIATAAMRCESTSPSRTHGCWRGVATVASVGALGIGVALLVADIVLTRRRRTELRSADAGE